mgnify:CR=1 FL=1
MFDSPLFAFLTIFCTVAFTYTFICFCTWFPFNLANHFYL